MGIHEILSRLYSMTILFFIYPFAVASPLPLGSCVYILYRSWIMIRILQIWGRPCKAINSLPSQCSRELWEHKNLILQKDTRKGIFYRLCFKLLPIGDIFNVFDTLRNVHFLQHSKIVVKELGLDPKVHIWNGEGDSDTIIRIGFCSYSFIWMVI